MEGRVVDTAGLERYNQTSNQIKRMQRWEKPPPAPAGRERKAAAESLPKQVGAAGAAPEHPGEESGRVQRVMLCKVAPVSGAIWVVPRNAQVGFRPF